MKKSNIASLVSAGLILLSGVAMSSFPSREKDEENIEAREIYIDSPRIVSESFSEKIREVSSDLVPEHPDSDKLVYNVPFPKGYDRVSSLIDGSALSEKLGRPANAMICVAEERIGKDLWKFHELVLAGNDLTDGLLEETVSRMPWVFEGIDLDNPTHVKKSPEGNTYVFEANAQSGKPYIVEGKRDGFGRISRITYHLSDGGKVILNDRNGNSIADEIINAEALTPRNN